LKLASDLLGDGASTPEGPADAPITSKNGANIASGRCFSVHVAAWRTETDLAPAVGLR
jgi:hypothetical protein